MLNCVIAISETWPRVYEPELQWLLQMVSCTDTSKTQGSRMSITHLADDYLECNVQGFSCTLSDYIG